MTWIIDSGLDRTEYIKLVHRSLIIPNGDGSTGCERAATLACWAEGAADASALQMLHTPVFAMLCTSHAPRSDSSQVRWPCWQVQLRKSICLVAAVRPLLILRVSARRLDLSELSMFSYSRTDAIALCQTICREDCSRKHHRSKHSKSRTATVAPAVQIGDRSLFTYGCCMDRARYQK